MKAGVDRGGATMRRRGRGLLLLSMAVLGLCVAHQVFMATLAHAILMGPLHERGVVAAAPPVASALGEPTMDGPGDRPLPSSPEPLLGDCPAQQAVIPLLLLLSLLLGVLTWRGGAPWLPARPRSHPPHEMPPPLLPPRQRRALLQVFTI